MSLAGREVVHTEAPDPWPPGHPLCDRLGRRMRVPPEGRTEAGRLALVDAGGREVTCGRCLRIEAAQAARKDRT